LISDQFSDQVIEVNPAKEIVASTESSTARDSTRATRAC
jgi:hypothetical protein